MSKLVASLSSRVLVTRSGARVDRRLGGRGDFRRNRQHIPFPYPVITDGEGNISSRPLTHELPCFADPVERLRGLNDELRRFGDKDPAPRGCAGCPVIAECGEVVQERLSSSAELSWRCDEWERDTATLPEALHYGRPTWAALVDAIEAQSWLDCNDAALIEAEKTKATDTRKRQARNQADKRQRDKKRPKTVPQDIADKITAYHDERAVELWLAYIAPNAPLWLRNRSEERVQLVADAWQAREMLRETGARGSGRQVADMLDAQGRRPTDVGDRFIKVVEETLRKVDELIADRDWPEFDPRPVTLRKAGNGMSRAAVFKQLDT